MPKHDLTPEEWEDLVDRGHGCDERCYRNGHSVGWTDDEDDADSTALALFECGPVGNAGNIDPHVLLSQLWRRARESLGLEGTSPDDVIARGRIAEKYAELLEDWQAEQRAYDLIRRAQAETERAV